MFRRHTTFTTAFFFSATVILCLVVWLGGCGQHDDANPSSDDSTTNGGGLKSDDSKHSAGEKRGPAPLLKGWTKPEITILFTGEQHGYFEPCGCTEMQSGGMARRDDLLSQIEAKKWPITALDLGGAAGRSSAQNKIKFDTLLDAFKDMKYQAVALGVEELRFGPDHLLSKAGDSSAGNSKSLSFLSANVTFFDIPDLGTPARTRIITIGKVKVGVTAIVGHNYEGIDILAKNDPNIKVVDPEVALPAAIEELKQQNPDLFVLLSHTDLEESRKLAKKFPIFDLVQSAGGSENPDGIPEKIGKTWLLTVGHKGKFVGVLGYYPGQKERFRFELVDLDRDRFQDSPRMVEHMRTYQNNLKDGRLAGNRSDGIDHDDHPSGSTFVGSQRCEECHSKAYAVWKDSKHAHAFDSLKHAREGTVDHKITRVYDPECLTCHVVGWDPQNVNRYKTGFINEEFAMGNAQKQMSKLLKGVQCENCHGPGSKHIELAETGDEDDEQAARKLMRVTLETAKKTTCYQCHDIDNSPHFNFDTYWPKIEHKGLD